MSVQGLDALLRPPPLLVSPLPPPPVDGAQEEFKSTCEDEKAVHTLPQKIRSMISRATRNTFSAVWSVYNALKFPSVSGGFSSISQMPSRVMGKGKELMRTIRDTSVNTWYINLLRFLLVPVTLGMVCLLVYASMFLPGMIGYVLGGMSNAAVAIFNVGIAITVAVIDCLYWTISPLLWPVSALGRSIISVPWFVPNEETPLSTKLDTLTVELVNLRFGVRHWTFKDHDALLRIEKLVTFHSTQMPALLSANATTTGPKQYRSLFPGMGKKSIIYSTEEAEIVSKIDKLLKRVNELETIVRNHEEKEEKVLTTALATATGAFLVTTIVLGTLSAIVTPAVMPALVSLSHACVFAIPFYLSSR